MLFDEGTKHKALQRLCTHGKIPLSQTMFVGDGENDSDILCEAGLGIAFCLKSKRVAEAADIVITKRDLHEILKVL